MSVVLAVIGSGQLGSRHLQALKLLDRPSSVFVLDPNPQALRAASELFAQQSGESLVQSIQFVSDTAELPDAIDVAVVATGANARRKVLQHLLAHSRVRYLILEKFLFQEHADYVAVAARMREAATKSWVNCPRRMWPIYRKLKEVVPGGPLDYRVTGSAWGLGCNAIHFLDHAAFLSGSGEFTLQSSELDPEVVASRRDGYCEFSGRIRGESKDGTRVEIACDRAGTMPVVVTAWNQDMQLLVNETACTAVVAQRENGWQWESLTFAVPFQSQLTHVAVQQLLDRGNCELTPYELSASLHVSLLDVFLEHYRKHVDSHATCCPIT